VKGFYWWKNTDLTSTNRYDFADMDVGNLLLEIHRMIFQSSVALVYGIRYEPYSL
jgi:hypothetical protein